MYKNRNRDSSKKLREEKCWKKLGSFTLLLTHVGHLHMFLSRWRILLAWLVPTSLATEVFLLAACPSPSEDDPQATSSSNLLREFAGFETDRVTSKGNKKISMCFLGVEADAALWFLSSLFLLRELNRRVTRESKKRKGYVSRVIFLVEFSQGILPIIWQSVRLCEWQVLEAGIASMSPMAQDTSLLPSDLVNATKI